VLVGSAALLAFTLGTAHLAVTRLRVAERAQRAGWRYQYGFYGAEPAEGGGEFRWARRRAAVVLEAPTRLVELSVGVNHLDIEQRPVEAKVWIDGSLVLDTPLTSNAMTTRVVPLPDGETRVLLETWVNRTLTPRDVGLDDDRELGLIVSWRFLDPLPAANRDDTSQVLR
jgi:hypothetical protein